MKIVIFGTGKYYQKRKEKISADTEIVAFIDNNPQLNGKRMDGIQIFLPYKINQISYDKIVLMSVNEKEMREQLFCLDVPEWNIWSWEQLNSEMWHGTFRLYAGNTQLKKNKKKVLIISTELNYNGGTLAAFYAAFALQSRGFEVVLAAQNGNSELIREIVNSGMNVMLCQGLPYLKDEEKMFIKQFDMVIVNVFQMISCACEISKILPAMWWIHEPSDMYKSITEKFSSYMDMDQMKMLCIYAVSSIAKRNFNHYFHGRIQKTLFYGIPDQRKSDMPGEKKGYLVFAMIGAVCPIKAQDVFVQAAQALSGDNRKNVQFWIIGSIGNDGYSDKIRETVSEDMSFKLWGELTRSEMQEMYRKIDIVISPSMEDCLPVVVTEGMMLQKVCIVSDHTGSADFIEEGVNGFIVPAGSVAGLKEKMEWVINHKEQHEAIGKKARETYEKYFAMDVFGGNLERAVEDTIKQWKYGRESL